MTDFQQSIGIGSSFNGALLDGTGCINVRPITMDEVTEVIRVQTSPAHRLKLGSSTIIFFCDCIEKVQDRHTSKCLLKTLC